MEVRWTRNHERERRGDGGGGTLILMPVYNDWEALAQVLRGLESVLRVEGMEAQVLIVDDGSSATLQPHSIDALEYRAIRELSILRLGRNVGHQRAIAIGLAHIAQKKRFDVVVIMDADGQDRPEDVPRLLRECAASPETLIFARRARRSESLPFVASYYFFKLVFWILTGRTMSFGNFSAVPASLVQKLILVPELWNHYPASVVKARLPFRSIPTQRAPRVRGESSMSYTNLVIHGLSAVSVLGDVVGVRALFATGGLIVSSALMLGVVVAIRTLTDWAIPGWASYLAVSFFIVLLQAVLLSVFFVMLVLNSRKLTDFLLCRDYEYFVLEERCLFSRNDHEKLQGIGAGAVPARA